MSELTLQIYRTPVCAADDAHMAMGRIIKIDSDSSVEKLIHTIMEHSDFNVLRPRLPNSIEVWHFQTKANTFATMRATSNSTKIISDTDALAMEIFEEEREIYIQRDVNEIARYNDEVKKQKQIARVQKSIARHNKKTNSN